MTYLAHMELTDAIGHINKGIGEMLEQKIKEALMARAEVVVEEVAKEMCKSLKHNLSACRSYQNDRYEITLIINGEKTDA